MLLKSKFELIFKIFHRPSEGLQVSCVFLEICVL